MRLTLFQQPSNTGEEIMDIVLVGVIGTLLISGIAGGLAVLVVALLLPRKSCPRCGTQLPRFRKPANLNQAMLGGWNCPSCGAKIGRNGSVLPDDA